MKKRMERETDSSAHRRRVRGFSQPVGAVTRSLILSLPLYVCVLLDVCLCEDQYDFYTGKVRMYWGTSGASPHVFTRMF